MTSQTRRRVTIAAVLALLTLPVETLILPVARTPDARAAAVLWAASLSAADLQSASGQIEDFPPNYRRAIMGVLDPDARSRVWRAHFRKFLQQHRALSRAQQQVVLDAMNLASSDAFAPPVRDDLKAQIQDAFNDTVAQLGPDAANDLFVMLGPKTPAVNALPIAEQIADRVRGWRTANAQFPDCNCNIDIDTCDLEPDPWLQCSELFTCNFDLHWPMCGPFWSWACTGWCRILRWPLEQ
jgi:hypothetical protein